MDTDTVNWRIQFQPDSRQQIVNKIVDFLKKYQTYSGEEGLNKIKKTAEVVEEKIFSAATSKTDYLREIRLKMLTMETKSQNTVSNSMPKNQVGNSNRPQDMVGGKSKNMRPAHDPLVDLHGDNPEKRVVARDDDLLPPPKKRLIEFPYGPRPADHVTKHILAPPASRAADDSVPKFPYGPRPADHVPKYILALPDSRAAGDSMPKLPYGPRPANHVTKHIMVPPPRRADHLSPAPAIPPLRSSTSPKAPDVPLGERTTRCADSADEEISKVGRHNDFKVALKLMKEGTARVEILANQNDSIERELRAVKTERDKLARDLRHAEEAKGAAAADSEREIKRLREAAQSDARRYKADIERLESEVAKYLTLAEEGAREAMELRLTALDPAATLVDAFWNGVDYCKARILERHPDLVLDFRFLDAADGTAVVATPQVELVHGEHLQLGDDEEDEARPFIS